MRSASRGATRLIRAGLAPTGMVYRNSGPGRLRQAAVRRQEGQMVPRGSFITTTMPHADRSPDDRFVIREPAAAGDMWCGKVHRPRDAAQAAGPGR